MSVCLLANAILKESTYTFHITSMAEPYHPFHLTSLFYLDIYSLTFIVLTLTISLYIVPFTLQYMKHEPQLKRFYILLNSFVGSMVLLLAANNI